MIHQPILVEEILDQYQAKPGDTLLDATLGTGGHAKAYLEATQPSGRVIGFDVDEKAIHEASKRLKGYGNRLETHVASYTQVAQIVKNPIEHILLDLGIGSHQLADQARGFSFAGEGLLTMRFGSSQIELPPSQIDTINSLTQRLGAYPDAKDIITGLTARELADILFIYGEERKSYKIAAAIKGNQKNIHTAKDLADVIAKVSPKHHQRIHPATRTFQALRLAVNRELESISTALPRMLEILKPGGVIAIISFHSLEDRIVKQYLREKKQQGILSLLNKKVIRAGEEEKSANPRSRSAKLRAAKKKT